MTQPAVSQQVTSLERHLGVELFERTSHGLELTDAGRVLAQQASPHLGALELLFAKVSSPTNLTGRWLTLFYRGTSDDAIAVPLVREMARRHPDIAIRLERFKNSKDKLSSLANGEADAVLFKAMPQGAPEGCAFAPLAYSRLMVVVPRSSELASAKTLSLDDLVAEPVNLTEDVGAHSLLRMPHGELRYQGVQNELYRRHRAQELVRFVPDTQTALTFTKADLGASLIDSAWINDADNVACIPFVPERTSGYGLYFADESSNSALEALVECALDLFCRKPFIAPGMRLEPPAVDDYHRQTTTVVLHEEQLYD